MKVPHVLLRWKRLLQLSLTNFNKNPPILVHQMGKVGSSTVYNSLRQANVENPIYHTHFLSYVSLDEVEKYYESIGADDYIYTLKYWRNLRRKIDRYHGKCYVISMVREPVGRLISDVFQNLTVHHKDLHTPDDEADTAKIITYLMDEFKQFDENTDYACTWFDREILDVFDLDVYHIPFDTEKGYVVMENDRARMLVVRMEDISRVMHEAIYKTFDLHIPILRSNEAASKEYYYNYTRVTDGIRLPKSICEKIYGSRYSRHFYTSYERNVFTEKWSIGNE